MNSLETMIEKARTVAKRAYAPYSHYPVGVCLRTDNNQLFTGCNVENASYSLTLCGEASAIANMVSYGERCIVEAVVYGTGKELCAPCGACRQRLNEFASAQTLIHICGPEGIRKTMTMAELLPESFGPANLDPANLSVASDNLGDN
jgi:cytidine deaminase